MFISHDTGAYAPQKPVLITGGAGFIGTNLAARLASLGQQVLVFDNLSRAGVEKNLNWLTATFPQQIHIKIADVRNKVAITGAVDASSMVFHFAAQVAVTTSIDTPMRDFEVNAGGTLNVLEAIRTSRHKPAIVYTSTNKVYGQMEDLQLAVNDNRYEPIDSSVGTNGFDENRMLDFYSPYGCSKGCADQYVLDYARTYGIRATVLRMSCIYGPHQHGNEDQGWVAHFIKQALEDNPLTIYGDGKQVRDILFVDDLVNAFLLTQSQTEVVGAKVFNIGGGPANTVSLLELTDMIGQLAGKKMSLRFEDWRKGDQKYYVSNTSKFSNLTGWQQRTNINKGVGLLYEWLWGEHQKKSHRIQFQEAGVR